MNASLNPRDKLPTLLYLYLPRNLHLKMWVVRILDKSFIPTESFLELLCLLFQFTVVTTNDSIRGNMIVSKYLLAVYVRY